MRAVIWLDDYRNPKQYVDLIQSLAMQGPTSTTHAYSVYWVKSYAEFVELVEKLPHEQIAVVCFDNDLGYDQKEGRHAFTWFEQRIREKGLGRVVLHAQTDNPAARREMRAGFAALYQWWREREAAQP